MKKLIALLVLVGPLMSCSVSRESWQFCENACAPFGGIKMVEDMPARHCYCVNGVHGGGQ